LQYAATTCDRCPVKAPVTALRRRYPLIMTAYLFAIAIAIANAIAYVFAFATYRIALILGAGG